MYCFLLLLWEGQYGAKIFFAVVRERISLRIKNNPDNYRDKIP